MRTMHTDGSSIDSGVLSPFFGNRDGLLRSLLVPIGVVCLAVFALAAVPLVPHRLRPRRRVDRPHVVAVAGIPLGDASPPGAGRRWSIRPGAATPPGHGDLRPPTTGGGDPRVLAEERGDHVPAGHRAEGAVRTAGSPADPATGSHTGSGTAIPNSSAALAAMIRCLTSAVSAG